MKAEPSDLSSTNVTGVTTAVNAASAAETGSVASADSEETDAMDLSSEYYPPGVSAGAISAVELMIEQQNVLIAAQHAAKATHASASGNAHANGGSGTSHATQQQHQQQQQQQQAETVTSSSGNGFIKAEHVAAGLAPLAADLALLAPPTLAAGKPQTRDKK